MKRYKPINCASTRHRFGLAFYSECEVTIFSTLPRTVTSLVALYMMGEGGSLQTMEALGGWVFLSQNPAGKGWRWSHGNMQAVQRCGGLQWGCVGRDWDWAALVWHWELVLLKLKLPFVARLSLNLCLELNIMKRSFNWQIFCTNFLIAKSTNTARSSRVRWTLL